MFNSIAYAADGGAASSPIAPFIPLILIFAIFYFFAYQTTAEETERAYSNAELNCCRRRDSDYRRNVW